MEILYKLKKELLKKGVNDLVLTQNEVQESNLKIVDNKIIKTETSSLTDIDIFAEKDKKLITTAIKDFDDNSIKEVTNKIIEFLNHSQPNIHYVRIPDKNLKYPQIEDGFDTKVKEIDGVDLTESAINAALKNSERTAGFFQKAVGKTKILTSTGIEKEDEFTSLYLSLRAFKTKQASGHQTASSRILSKFNAEKTGQKAGEIASMALSPIEGKPGKYNIVFSPLAFAPILNSIGDAASIFAVESGMSFLANQKKKLGNFSLIDNGILSNGMNSSVYDEEGHPKQKTIVIDNGKLKTFLHNTSTADRYKVDSTGNAGIISPDPTNIIIEGETGDPFDIKTGIYLTNVWYTRFQNYATGDFSTIPRDGMFLIKNGKIDQPIQNLRISDNVLNLLKNIQVFGKDKEQITSWEASTPVITAPVLIKKVNITKPTS